LEKRVTLLFALLGSEICSDEQPDRSLDINRMYILEMCANNKKKLKHTNKHKQNKQIRSGVSPLFVNDGDFSVIHK
jgi:DNA-binding CsgD family transcriptional regulator